MEQAVSPRSEYDRRRTARQFEINKLKVVDDRVGSVGLWAASATVLILVASGFSTLSGFWALLPAVVVLVARMIHLRYDARIAVFDSGVKHYDRGLARMDDRWAGSGREGREFESPGHPYAADLDLFGRGSLFELLCTVQTRAGEKMLARWLMSPGTPAEIRERQAGVRELRDRLDLREDLARLGGEAAAGIRPDDLSAWGGATAELTPGIRAVARILTALSIASLGLFIGGVSAYPFAAVVLAILTFNWRCSGRVAHAADLGERAERELDLLSSVLRRLGKEPFASSRLLALQTRMIEASTHVAHLARLVQRLQSVRNELVRAVAGLFLWKAHCAFALEDWRRRWGREVPGWMDAVGEIEALGALATYAYENPDDPFPEILEGEPRFEGEQLGHPLLARRTCVRNDVRLGGKPRVLIVSGSNMSGKSTLLRTIGVNATLALAGAPVRAKRLALTPLALGATIRVQDSLQAGMSRFYAEISRIKQIMEIAAGPRPLLFLLEEVLAGTNSQDRKTGAELLVKEFLSRNAIGLVTTHDLALASAADALDGAAMNVHFEDHLVDGKLSFDYILRPGVVTKSNALALMQAIGLLDGKPPASPSKN